MGPNDFGPSAIVQTFNQLPVEGGANQSSFLLDGTTYSFSPGSFDITSTGCISGNCIENTVANAEWNIALSTPAFSVGGILGARDNSLVSTLKAPLLFSMTRLALRSWASSIQWGLTRIPTRASSAFSRTVHSSALSASTRTVVSHQCGWITSRLRRRRHRLRRPPPLSLSSQPASARWGCLAGGGSGRPPP